METSDTQKAPRSHKAIFLMLGIMIGLMLSGTAVAGSFLTRAKGDARYVEQKKTRVIVSSQVTITANTFNNQPIMCPDGMQALGGGYELVSPGVVGVFATASHPLASGAGAGAFPPPEGWHVVLKNSTGFDENAIIYVTCAR